MTVVENENAQAAALSPSPATTSQVVVAQQVKVLYGWSVNESTGSGTAKVRVRDGSGTGKVLGVINLASAASSTVFMSEQAVQVNTGALYLEVVSGSVEGVLYWG